MRTIIAGVLVVVLSFAAPLAVAATITVDWSGSGEYLTIQDGVDAAGPGDTVLVLAGTYTGAGNRDIDFGGTSLVLLSDEGHILTTVDCEDAGRGFLFHSSEDTNSVVSGFTIANAAADSGAGAFCWNGSNPRFEGCLFLSNTAQMRGGGLCCLGSSPVVRGCWFEGNEANQDGSSNGKGGGISCLQGSSPLITDTDIYMNVAYNNGGGLHSYYSSPNCVRCWIAWNNLLSYGNEGGGVGLNFSDGAALAQCIIRENGTSQTIVGGGLHANGSDITVTGCEFLDNRAGAAGGAHFSNSPNVTLTGCTFAGNLTAWGGTAGGLTCQSGSDLTITNCTFADNQGHHMWCQGASPTIEYSIFAYSVSGTAVSCREGTETPHIHHCFVYGNADGDTLCGGNFHDIENSDPLFCDMSGENFALCADSPCIAGVTWPSLVGAHAQGCPACGNAVEPTSWGAIKAMYR